MLADDPWRIGGGAIHQRAWKGNSANFALTAFSEIGAEVRSGATLLSTWRTRRRRRRSVSEANKELVRRHFEEIFNRKNFAACDEMMAEDYLEHAPAPFSEDSPGKVTGP
jgi:hypothetical protein